MIIIKLIFVSITAFSVQCLDVKTSSGTVRGLEVTALNNTVYQYLNIPYAEPPVRFARPVPKRPEHVSDNASSLNLTRGMG